MQEIGSVPLIGWGNALKNDAECRIELLTHNPLASLTTTPELEYGEYLSHVWWNGDRSKIGVSVGDQSLVWDHSRVAEYVVGVAYPSEWGGSCGFGFSAEAVPERSRIERFLCVRMPYSSASLEKLLKLATVLSKIAPAPVTMVQWSDSRAS